MYFIDMNLVLYMAEMILVPTITIFVLALINR